MAKPPPHPDMESCKEVVAAIALYLTERGFSCKVDVDSNIKITGHCGMVVASVLVVNEHAACFVPKGRTIRELADPAFFDKLFADLNGVDGLTRQ